MEKPTWGCPECGSDEVFQHVTMEATRGGTFRQQNGSWTFDGEEEVDRDSLDLADEGEFECGSCGETFKQPSRVRHDDGIRVALKVTGTAYRPDDNGVEQELDDDLCARVEVVCTDREQAKRLFETLRLFLQGVVGTAQAGAGQRVA
jgi:hypothetical protein